MERQAFHRHVDVGDIGTGGTQGTYYGFSGVIANVLNNKLADKLSINVEYPWGTRNAEITLEFYNKPVGE